MKTILYILLIAISTTISAQTDVFNRTFTRNTPVMRNVLITDDGYVAVGGDYSSLWKVELLIVGFDDFGNKLWEKSYGNDLFDYYHGSSNSIIKNYDGGYSLSGSKNDATNISCLLVKFDQNFDTLWTKLYFDNPDFTVFYNHIQTTDGGYALVGSNDESDPDGDVLLVKTDSNGNMQWYKKYGTSARDLGFCIVSTDDGGYLIGGSTDGLGHGDGYLIKTDSEGNQQWTRHYGNPLYPDGSINTIVKSANNDFILPLSSYVTDPISTSFFNRRYSIIKFDSDFNEVWNNIYGVRAEYTGLGSITVANNGDIMATITDDHISGVMRISAEGDSISTIYYPTGESIGESALLAIKQTPDNGYIMAGVAFDPQVMWLVKTDSCGCVVEDCECGGSEIEQVWVDGEIEVYPNPASDLLYYILPKNSGDAEIFIYDAMGRIVQSEKIVNNKNSINIRTLTAGTYVLKVQFSDNCRTTGFIKN